MQFLQMKFVILEDEKLSFQFEKQKATALFLCTPFKSNATHLYVTSNFRGSCSLFQLFLLLSFLPIMKLVTRGGWRLI